MSVTPGISIFVKKKNRNIFKEPMKIFLQHSKIAISLVTKSGNFIFLDFHRFNATHGDDHAVETNMSNSSRKYWLCFHLYGAY